MRKLRLIQHGQIIPRQSSRFTFQTPSFLTSAVVIAVTIQVGAGALGALAGEAIDFSGGKSKVDTSLENRLSKEKASATHHRLPVDTQQPLEGIAKPQTGPNRKEEKRRKDEEIEKKSWILLDRGQLQNGDKSEGDFGVRDDAMEGEKTAADIWFSRKDERSPKAPHQPSTGPKAPSERPIVSRPEVEEKAEPRSKEPDKAQVTHTVREMEVRTSLVEPGAKDLLGPRTGGGFDSANGDRGRRDGGFRFGNSDIGRSTSIQGPSLGRDSLTRPGSPGLSGGLNGPNPRLSDSPAGPGYNFNGAPLSPSYNNGAQNGQIQQPRNAFGVESSRSGR